MDACDQLPWESFPLLSSIPRERSMESAFHSQSLHMHSAAIQFCIRTSICRSQVCGSIVFAVIDQVSTDLCSHTGPGWRTRNGQLLIRSYLWYYICFKLTLVQTGCQSTRSWPSCLPWRLGRKEGGGIQPALFALLKRQNMLIHSEEINGQRTAERRVGRRGLVGQRTMPQRYPCQIDVAFALSL